MQEHHYYHQPRRPRSGAQKALTFLALSAAAAMFAGVCALTINAMSSGGETDTAAGSRIKFYGYPSGAGAGGYDVVAYFSEAKAQKGSAAHRAEWGGETWHFASPENRDEFLRNPAQYIPQYGGHCAYGVAQGYLVRGDPQAWSVRGDKLYLNYNASIRVAWLAAAEQFIADAVPSWKKLNR